MKKIITIFLSIIMVYGFFNISYAVETTLTRYDDAMIISNLTDTIKVQQNGNYIDFTDDMGNKVEPQIINNRTMVPFRKIFNSLGVSDNDITWVGDTRTVLAKKDNIEIELQIDNNVAKKTVDGNKTEIKLDSAPVIVEGRTLVPVRFIAESMNKQVGWDSLNRTVIIIDTQELINDLEKSIPNYMELMNSNCRNPESYSMDMNLTGKLDYKDSQNKSNNFNINLNGNIKMQQNVDMISINGDIKLTGKGEVYDALKESKLNKIDFSIILAGKTVYLNSSLLDNETNGKWVMTENYEGGDLIASLNNDSSSIENIFTINEEELNINTYEYLEVTTTILKELFKDDNIKITKKGSTTTFEIKLTASDIIDVLSKLGLDIDVKKLGIDGNIKAKSTYKNNISQSSSCEVKINYTEGSEKIAFEVTADGKITESNVEISIPDSSSVVNLNEI